MANFNERHGPTSRKYAAEQGISLFRFYEAKTEVTRFLFRKHKRRLIWNAHAWFRYIFSGSACTRFLESIHQRVCLRGKKI